MKKEATTFAPDEALTVEKEPAQAVYYVFDQGGRVLYEQENRKYMEYIYILGRHFTRVDGHLDTLEVNKYFYHIDHLGSAVLIPDTSGQTVWSSEYTPFGRITMEDELLYQRTVSHFLDFNIKKGV